MWQAIHEFIFAIRFLVAPVCLVGVVYAVFLVIRSFPPALRAVKGLLAREKTETRTQRKLKERLQKPGPPPAPVDEEGQQGNLLSTLPDDSVAPAQAPAAVDGGAEPGAAADAEPQPSTHPLTALHLQKPDQEHPTSYGIDPKARTRFNLERTPTTAPLTKAEPEQEAQPTDEQVGTTTKPDSEQASQLYDPRRRTDILEEPSVAAEAAGKSEADTEKTAAGGKAAEAKPKKVATEILRRADGMEKRGFHIGIQPDDHENDPRNITAEEKERFLSGLGLEEEGVASGEGQVADRMRTTELEDILSRLDNALANTFDSETAAEDNTATAEREFDISDDKRNGSGVNDDSTTRLGQPAVPPETDGKNDTTVEAVPSDPGTDANIPTPTDEREIKTEKLATDRETGQVGTGPASAIQQQLRQRDRESEAPASGDTNEGPATTDAEGSDTAAPAGNADDRPGSTTSGEETDRSTSPPSAGDEETDAAEDQAPESPRTPTDPVDSIPDWARADTFDDDKPDQLGEQTDLFKQDS